MANSEARNFEVVLQNGRILTLTGALINLSEFTATLNDNTITFVGLGDCIVNKHLIQSITPVN